MDTHHLHGDIKVGFHGDVPEELARHFNEHYTREGVKHMLDKEEAVIFKGHKYKIEQPTEEGGIPSFRKSHHY